VLLSLVYSNIDTQVEALMTDLSVFYD